MRAILDTNVIVSAIYFGGVLARILGAWGMESFELVVSPPILDEYEEVCERMQPVAPGVRYSPVLSLIRAQATIVLAPPTGEPISRDRDDDKFIECAKMFDIPRPCIVTGDKDLLVIDRRSEIRIISPRTFLAEIE